MNKIIVNRNIISSNIDSVIINENTITFNKDGYYEIDYVGCENLDIRFIVNANIKLLESSFDEELIVNNNYVVNDGSLSVVKFYNNKKVSEKIDIDLCGFGSKIDYKFSNICRESENYLININHNARNTVSNINNKSIALNNSNLNFVINSNIGKEQCGSILNQNTRIVTMGECETKISPNMFIDLDDVEARHGSVIGTFKDEQIFYLMSKGISYNDSLKLLIKGYLFSNVDVDGDIKKKIMDIIDIYWG